MNRIFKCVKFQLNRMIKNSLIFTGFYLLLYFLASTILSFAAVTSGGRGYVNTNYAFTVVLFLFINIGTSYKALYNNLLIYGNTRKIITISFYISYCLLTMAFAILSLLSIYLNDFCGKIFNFRTSDILNLIYSSNTNAAEKLLWFFAMLSFVSVAALIYGVLHYRFGKAFTRIFWTAFGLSLIVTPIFTQVNTHKLVGNALKFLFGYGFKNGILLSSINFLTITIILGFLNYILARYQPQKI